MKPTVQGSWCLPADSCWIWSFRGESDISPGLKRHNIEIFYKKKFNHFTEPLGFSYQLEFKAMCWMLNP